jgi:calcium release-activated calcium channel protein 1
MVEISLDDHTESFTSTPILITYSTLTCLLVSVHLLALMISTCILPLLETDHILNYEHLGTMQIYIEFAWILSTGFGEKLFNKKKSN